MTSPSAYIYNSGLVTLNRSISNVLLVDTNVLATLYQANQLNLLLDSGRQIVIPQTVFNEAVTTNDPNSAGFGRSEGIRNWVAANPGSVTVDTSLPYPAAGSALNVGEAALQMYANAYGNQQDIRMLSDDLNFIYGQNRDPFNRVDITGTSGPNLTTTEFTNDLFLSGAISPWTQTFAAASIVGTGRLSGDQINTLIQPGSEVLVQGRNGGAFNYLDLGPLGGVFRDENGNPTGYLAPWQHLNPGPPNGDPWGSIRSKQMAN
jgi:hypothetical protein